MLSRRSATDDAVALSSGRKRTADSRTFGWGSRAMSAEHLEITGVGGAREARDGACSHVGSFRHVICGPEDGFHRRRRCPCSAPRAPMMLSRLATVLAAERVDECGHNLTARGVVCQPGSFVIGGAALAAAARDLQQMRVLTRRTRRLPGSGSSKHPEEVPLVPRVAQTNQDVPWLESALAGCRPLSSSASRVLPGRPNVLDDVAQMREGARWPSAMR